MSDVIHSPVTGPELFDAYGAAIKAVDGVYPTREQALVLTSQTWEETGGVHCYNWNVGNVKVLPGHDSMDLLTREVINGVSKMMKCAFASFVVLGADGKPDPVASLAAGCEAQVRFLQAHYPAAYEASKLGDPAAFATAAKVHGYFTGSLLAYRAGMVSCFQHFRATLPPAAWEAAPTP